LSLILKPAARENPRFGRRRPLGCGHNAPRPVDPGHHPSRLVYPARTARPSLRATPDETPAPSLRPRCSCSRPEAVKAVGGPSAAEIRGAPYWSPEGAVSGPSLGVPTVLWRARRHQPNCIRSSARRPPPIHEIVSRRQSVAFLPRPFLALSARLCIRNRPPTAITEKHAHCSKDIAAASPIGRRSLARWRRPSPSLHRLSPGGEAATPFHPDF